MTTEEKARRYDKALERAKYCLTTDMDDSGHWAVKHIFPELKENEDERIRTELINGFKECLKNSQYPKNAKKYWHNIKIEDILTWLEKQYEKPTDKIEPRFKVGDKIKDCNYKGEPIYEIQRIDSDCYICKYTGEKNLGDRSIMHFSINNPYLKLVEQNPFIDGALRTDKHLKNLWHDAQGDLLPEIDREVIVLTQPYPLERNEYAVSFAHRPNPNGWDGKSVTTGEIEHYTPKTYDKGGWNIPNAKWWLDVELPNKEDEQ